MSAVVFTLDLAKIFHLNNRNPLYLLVIFVVYLVGKAIWVQSEIGREFQHGFVSIEITHFSVTLFWPPEYFNDFFMLALSHSFLPSFRCQQNLFPL